MNVEFRELVKVLWFSSTENWEWSLYTTRKHNSWFATISSSKNLDLDNTCLWHMQLRHMKEAEMSILSK